MPASPLENGSRRKSQRLDYRDYFCAGDAGFARLYHVHKNILSVGSKQSLYFARVFANKTLQEHATSTSRIELDPLAADAFPILLDYIYSWNSDAPAITHENAAALHHLGNYFEISRLRIQVQQFWKENMTFGECAMYYQHAIRFSDNKLQAAVAKICCSGNQPADVCTILSTVLSDDPHHPCCVWELIRASDQRLWLKALKMNQGANNCCLSLLVSLFVEQQYQLEEAAAAKDDDDDHHHHLSAETFFKLTHKDWLPEIHWKAALRFLVVEQGILSLSNGGDSDDGDWKELSQNLQERCVKGIVLDWHELDSGTGITETLGKLRPAVLSEILMRTVQQSKEELSRTKRKLRYTRQGWPSSVLVRGAGTAAINGVYVRSSKHCTGVPSFAMSGQWNGEPVEFVMYFTKVNQGEAYNWRIACNPPNGNGKIYFYKFFVGKNDVKLPPKRGWIRCRDPASVRPAPTLVHSFEQGDNESLSSTT